MLKIILPAIGESFHHKHSPEQFGIVLCAYIESSDIAHFYAMWVFFDQFDSVTSSDFSLLQHGAIEARAFACQKSLDDIEVAEFDAELVAGIRGSVTMTRAEPTRNLSPILSSDSNSPVVVKFSPNMPQGSFMPGSSCFQ
jgi:hypothetical protein